MSDDIEGNAKIHFKGLKDFMPGDTKPLTYEGKIAGIRVKCVNSSDAANGGYVDLIGPKALWYAHDMRAGNWFGRSVLLGAQSTYEELNQKDGARDSRFHWYYRHAFRGPSVRYPTQAFVKPGADGALTYLDGRDIAVEIATLGKNGQAMILPNMRDNNGEQMFTVEWPQQATSSGMDIREYCQDLTAETWNGMEIPDEIISADGTGALAGRRVPERGFYASREDDLNEIIDWFVIQWLQPIAILNYGRDRGQFELMIGEIAPAQEAPADNKEGEPQPAKDPLADWLGGGQDEQGGNDRPFNDGPDDDKPKPGQQFSTATAKRIKMWQPNLADDELAMIRGETVISRKGRVQMSVAVKLSDGKFNIPIAGQSMLDPIAKIAATRGMFLSNELKNKLLRLAKKNPEPNEFLRAAARLIQQIQPRLAALVRDSIIASWIMGAKRGSLHLPKDVQADLEAAGTSHTTPLLESLKESGAIENRVPSVRTAFYHPGEVPTVNFPGIDEAFADLQSRHILEAADFYKLGDQARAAAFTVSHVNGIDTLETIRDRLAEAVSQGTTQEHFADAIGDAMDASPLGESHLETVFRNNVQSAASAGQETVINDPLVIDAFPYAIYEGIEDTRQRETHQEMMHQGFVVDGTPTNIYRSDDPIWDKWTPPNGHRCRCGKTFITLRQAARLGVPEAKRWLETGTKPVNPWFTKTTLEPDPGFAHRPSVGGSAVGLSRPTCGHDLRSPKTMILSGRLFKRGDAIPTAVLDDLAVVKYFGRVQLSTLHAPPGGITVDGTEYKGGMFIPGSAQGSAKKSAGEAVKRIKNEWDGARFSRSNKADKAAVLKELGYSKEDADDITKAIDGADEMQQHDLFEDAFHSAPIHHIADAELSDGDTDEDLTADKLNAWWSQSPDHFLDQLESRLEAEGVKSLKITSIASEAADLVEAGEADKAAEVIGKALPPKTKKEAAKEEPKAEEIEDEFTPPKPIDVDGLQFIPHPHSRYDRDEYRTVMADARRLDSHWSKDDQNYLPEDRPGSSEINGRREDFEHFLTKGKPIEQPHVVVDSKGDLSFDDGRHRTRVLMNRGQQIIPLTVHKDSADRVEELVGAGPKKKPTADAPLRQEGLFTREDLSGVPQLFDTGREFVDPKKSSTKSPEATPSTLEKIEDDLKARDSAATVLPGQKTIEEEPIEELPTPEQINEEAKTYADVDKKFSDSQLANMRRPVHELTEPEFLESKRLNGWRQAERNVIGFRKRLEELDKAPRTKTSTKEETLASLEYWEKQAKQLRESSGASDVGDRDREYHRGQYRDAVKQAISKGLLTDSKIIDQYPEFRKARDARERYEKGRHTSFANKSIAVDHSTRDARGYKAKRQDGKPMTPDVAKYFDDSVNEVEKVLGPLGDLFRHTDVTLAHTNGKHPFLSTAGGLYHPSEKTITAGISVGGKGGFPVKAFAHELGHWLDDEAGVASGKNTSVMHFTYGNHAKGKRIDSSKVSEANERLNSGHPEYTGLFDTARRKINDMREVVRLTKSKYDDAKDDADKVKIEKAKVTLGPYWRTNSEIWARLFEQYIADELGNDSKLVSAEHDYHTTPGWWTKEDFAGMKPLVKIEIERRLAALRAAAEKAKG
jgi:hypothetical protein